MESGVVSWCACYKKWRVFSAPRTGGERIVPPTANLQKHVASNVKNSTHLSESENEVSQRMA